MGESETSAIDPTQMIELVNAFLGAPLDEKQRQIEHKPEYLLRPEAEAALRSAADDAAADDDADGASYLRAHADLLAACRAHGAAKAFADLESGHGKSPQEQQFNDWINEYQKLATGTTEPSEFVFERQIFLCQQILGMRAAFPQIAEFWTSIKTAMATAMRDLSRLNHDATLLRSAAETFRQAQSEIGIAGRTDLHAVIAQSLGDTLTLLEEVTPDADLLREAETLYRSVLLTPTRHGSPIDRRKVYRNIGAVLQRIATRTGSDAPLLDAVDAYRAALQEPTREITPDELRDTLCTLGTILATIGNKTRDLAKLGEAATALRAALDGYPRGQSLDEWPMARETLGFALMRLGTLSADPTALREAATVCREALNEQEHASKGWIRLHICLGAALHGLGTLTQDADVLREAETVLRGALAACAREQAPVDLSSIKNNLGNVLSTLGRLTKNTATLREAIDILREALDARPRERSPVEWAETQNNLGAALTHLGDITEDHAVLVDAAEAYRAAATERLTRAPFEWMETQKNLGLVLTHLGILTNSSTALREAEAAYRAVLEEDLLEPTDPDRGPIQESIGNLLARIGEIDNNALAFKEAETAYRAAQACLDDDARSSIGMLLEGKIGVMLARFGTLTGDVNALRRSEAAIETVLARHDLELTDAARIELRAYRGDALLRIGALTEDLSALRDAAATYRTILREHAEQGGLGAVHAALGHALIMLAGHSDHGTEAHEATIAYRAALDSFSPTEAPSEWAAVNAQFCRALILLGEMTREPEWLREALVACRAALDTYPEAGFPANRTEMQGHRGVALLRLGEFTGDTATLTDARDVLRTLSEAHARTNARTEAARAQKHLAEALLHLGELTGNMANYREAEAAGRAAHECLTREASPPDWADIHNALGLVLCRLGTLTGSSTMLREAESSLCAALEVRTRTRTPTDWARTQNNLGIVLRNLGSLTGDAVTVRQSAEAFRAALTHRTSERMPMNWAMTQQNLGNTLRQLGGLIHDVDIFREAEDAYRAALTVYSFDRTPAQWATTQNNLAGVLYSIGEATEDVATLRNSANAQLSALEVRTKERTPRQWATSQINLGATLSAIGRLTNDASALHQAHATYRAAMEVLTRESAPIDWATIQNNLGTLLEELADVSGDEAMLHAAETAYRNALYILETSDDEEVRQQPTRSLAYLLIGLERYTDAAAIIEPALARSDLAIIDASRSGDGRARAVERVSEFYGMLSLCRMRQAHPDVPAAFAAAAAGRARLLADSLALDAVHLDEVEDPEIRSLIQASLDQRTALRRRLGYGQSSIETESDEELSTDERERLEVRLREASDIYMTLCREHGLISIPEALSAAEIGAAAPPNGALVLPVLTERCAFAFIVADGLAEPIVIDPLPLDRRIVSGHLFGEDGWLGIYHKHFHAPRGHALDGAAQRVASDRWHAQLIATQTWLWERLLGEVHCRLRDEAKLGAKAPVVLLAPGLLGLLPLHAAGPDPDGQHFCDHWTVSYIPSVRALQVCRQRADRRGIVPTKLLAVIDPKGDLSGAQQEAPVLRRHFAHCEHEILLETHATLAAVLAHLPSATCFHASTHGWHDWRHPRQSGLQLADTPLQLKMLQETRLDNTRLAFLSACESALSGVQRLAEEFVGLPAGFVQAGAACVVGNLWPINDQAAFLLANKFYSSHLDSEGRERMPPAEALAEAQFWLRQLNFGMLKEMFPVHATPDGSWVMLGGTARFADAEPGIPLPLGNDGDRPFAAPTYWAAYTVTGT